MKRIVTSRPRVRTEVIAEDIGTVRRLCESTGFFSDAEVDVAAELVQERLEKGTLSGYHFLFSETEGGVSGYACYGPVACTVGTFELYWIVVDDAFRGHGLGSVLLGEVEQVIRMLGGRMIVLDTSARAAYTPTRAFYERRDYTVAAVIDDFYAPGDGKVIFRKVLG